MRLTGRVADQRVAFAHCGGHHDVFGASYRWLVKEHLGASQARGQGEVVTAIDDDGGAQLLQAVEMRVEPSAANHITSGRVELGLAHAVQQRRHTQDGCAHLMAQLAADFAAVQLRRMDADAFSTALHLAPQRSDHV